MFGRGGAGGNAVNNMITSGLQGVDFVVANTDAQALTMSKAERIIQMGVQVTEGLGAGSQPEVGRAAAEEVIDEIRDHLQGAHMVFVTAGMGGGTGTGAAPVVARCAKELGILTVGVVTKPFHFEGVRRMRVAEAGIAELQKVVDTLLIIPNQNLFRVANEKTTFADAFAMADQVLYSGVACITDLMVKEGLINLDFADVRAVMREMGKAMMGTGEASGEKRALAAAEAAISNPLIDDASMKGAQGPADLDHRRQGSHPLRGRRGRHPHPRGGRPGRQHHRRRDLRRKPRRHHPRVGGGDRHRPGRRSGAAAGVWRRRRGSPSSRRSCGPTSSALRRAASSAREPRAPVHDAVSPHRGRAADHASPQRGDRAGRQGRGRGRGAADHGDRGRDDPADPAEAVAVPGAGARPTPQPSRRRPGAFIPPAPERAGRAAAAHAAASTNCRCRRRTSCAPSAARRRSPKHPEKRRMGLLQRLASVGLGRRDERGAGRAGECPAGLRPVPRAGRARAAPPPPARPRRPAAGCRAVRSRSPNTPSGRPTRGSTRTAGRRLCITRPRTINSKSRPSCAGRPTDGAWCHAESGPGARRRDRSCVWTICA